MKIKAVTAEIMAEIDRRAQDDYGIPELVLMENAGRKVAECVLLDGISLRDRKIAIFCGKGNNGGDGFVAARYLADALPGSIIVYAVDGKSDKKTASNINFQIIRNMDIPIKQFSDFYSDKRVNDFTICVDAVFGTGFKGSLRREYADLGEAVNASGMKVYAADVPSGLDASTGIASENCFKAHKTVTFGLPKKGFYVNDGPSVCGEIVVKNIGFPGALLERYCR